VLYHIFVHQEFMGGYKASMPDFPGCCPEGDDMDDLMLQIQPAVEAWMAENKYCQLPEASTLEKVMASADTQAIPLLVEVDDTFLK